MRLFPLCRSVFDHRFPPEEEAVYVQSLEHHFLIPLGSGAVITTILSLLAIYYDHGTLKAASNDDLFVLVMVLIRILVLLTSLMVLVICFLKRRRGILVCISLEGLGLVWASVVELTTCWFNLWHGSWLFGKDPKAMLAAEVICGSDGGALMTVAAIICGGCLVAPVRLHVAWLMPSFGIISYLFVSLFVGGPSSPVYFTGNVGKLFCVTVCALYGSYKNEVHLRREWRAQQKVGEQRNLLESQYDGVCRILSVLCDCIIRLGSDCHILEPCPRFAAILMKSNGQNLQGSNIEDFIPDPSDKERFREMLHFDLSGSYSELQPRTPTAGMFHINLRDAYGQDFPVDVYHTQIVHKENIEYLVGIAERQPRENFTRARSPVIDEVRTKSNEPEMIGLIQGCGRGEVSEESLSSSVGSAADTSSGGLSNLGVVAVDILADNTGLPIIGCTPGFTTLIGPITQGQRLVDFLAVGQGLELCVQDMVNVFQNSCTNVVLDGVIFAKPRSRIQYTIGATCLDFSSITARAEDTYEIVMRLELDGILQQRSRRGSRRRRSNPNVNPNVSL